MFSVQWNRWFGLSKWMRMNAIQTIGKDKKNWKITYALVEIFSIVKSIIILNTQRFSFCVTSINSLDNNAIVLKKERNRKK